MPGMIHSGHATPFSYGQVDPFQRMAGRYRASNGSVRSRGYSDLLGNRYSSPFPTVNALAGRVPQSAGFRDAMSRQIMSRPSYLGKTPFKQAGNIGRGLRSGAGFIPLDIALTGADMLSQGMTNSVRWAAKTGREEDYIGGFVYGATRAAGASTAATAGAVVGGALGSLVLPGLGTIVGGIAGGMAGYTVGETAIGDYAYQQGRFFSSIAATGVSKNKIEFGTGFEDSEAAFTMRQLAVQEMAGSLLNARQYLGNEASFFHR